MSFVREKEEWLVDWSEARCLGEVAFERVGASWDDILHSSGSREESEEVFFSDIIETPSQCLVCRATGAVVDLFDITPTAPSFSSYRVLLPSPVLRDLGISFSRDAHVVRIFFLTKARSLHWFDVPAKETLEVRLGLSFPVQLPSHPLSFCALGRDLVAIGCQDGTLHIRELPHSQVSPAPGGFQLVDAPLLKRLIGSCGQSPSVLALAAVGQEQRAGLLPGFQLLSFSSDGQLRLWEVTDRGGSLLAKQTASPQDLPAEPLGQHSFVYLKVIPSNRRACLVLPARVVMVEVTVAFPNGYGLICHSADHPALQGACPSLVTITGSSLWGFWSRGAAEQLLQIRVEGETGSSGWRKLALAANRATDKEEGLQRLVTEGCGESSASAFTLRQQREVWRIEEDGFDATKAVEVLCSDHAKASTAAVEKAVLTWWAGRILLPGRYSAGILAAALLQCGETTLHPIQRRDKGTAFTGPALRQAVARHLERQSAQQRRGTPESVANAIGAAAQNLLLACDTLWDKQHEVCGVAGSYLWASHCSWPTGDGLLELSGNGRAGCVFPLLLCHGGVSCIRAVHTWAERWWSTLHLSYSQELHVELEDVFGLSHLKEWKLCSTAWFFFQALASANLGLGLLHGLPTAAGLAQRLQRFLKDVPPSVACHVLRCIQSAAAGGLEAEKPAMILEQLRKALTILSLSLETEAVFEPNLAGMLRRATFLTEGAHLRDAVRDLLVFSIYATNAPLREYRWAVEDEAAAWRDLAAKLEEVLPRVTRTLDAIAAEVPSRRTTGLTGPASAPTDPHGGNWWEGLDISAEEGRTKALNHLHERAPLGHPLTGSAALLSFQQLYALYFLKGEYLQAATVAFTLYSSLHRLRAGSGLQVLASDSRAGLIEQERDALLMLISALAQTEEQSTFLLVQQGHELPDFDSAGEVTVDSVLENPAAYQAWFRQAEEAQALRTVSLRRAQDLLAETEVRSSLISVV